MTKRERLQMLITGKTPKILEGFRAFDEGVATLKKNLEETIKVDTLDEVGKKINEVKKKIDFQPILDAVSNLKREIETNDAQQKKELDNRLISLKAELITADKDNIKGIKDIRDEIQNIQTQIADILSRKPAEIPDFAKQIRETETRMTDFINKIERYNDTDLQKEVDDLEKELKKLRAELLTRINDRGGGNMNRNIAVGGNTSVLSKYTDVNIKPGSNITLTYSNNNASKYLDLTIASSGGAGTSRSISTVAVSSVAAATAATDIVILASAGIKITLPTALGNNNLYTIKNVGSSSIMIVGTGGETIDTAPNIIMPVQFTSVDLISDNINWNIT